MEQIQFIIQGDLLEYEPIFQKYGHVVLNIKKGSLISEQCNTNTLYYLAEGIAKVYIINSDGSERVIDFMKKGTLIAMDCVIPGSRAVVSIVGLTDLKVIPIPDHTLQELVKNHPDVGYQIILFYSKILRQVSYSSAITSISNYTSRLLYFLMLFLDEPEFKQSNEIRITQDEIANATAMSRAQVAKILAQLRQQGIIDTKNRYIIIKDANAISELAKQSN